MPSWLSELADDHLQLRLRLDVLDATADLSSPAALGHLTALLTFLAQHSRQEEATLFRALAASQPRGHGPLVVAEAEHVALDAVSGRLALATRSLQERSGRSAVARLTLRRDLPLMARLLRRHLAHEEATLFPLAENLP